MELLKQRILQEGKCLKGEVLKVDNFINHQMDPLLMFEMAKEFAVRFKDVPVNKIVTIEASGIAPAIMLGYQLQLPVVFVKKNIPATIENMITTSVHSFTKGCDYRVCVSADFLTSSDSVLFIDDFLANGNAALGIIELVEKAGATLAGMGFLIEKGFQEGGKILRERGIRVESLAIIEDLSGCRIKMKD